MEPSESRLKTSVRTTMETEVSGAQFAKKRLYSLGEVTGYDRLKEASGGGERSRKVKRRKM